MHNLPKVTQLVSDRARTRSKQMPWTQKFRRCWLSRWTKCRAATWVGSVSPRPRPGECQNWIWIQVCLHPACAFFTVAQPTPKEIGLVVATRSFHRSEALGRGGGGGEGFQASSLRLPPLQPVQVAAASSPWL